MSHLASFLNKKFAHDSVKITFDMLRQFGYAIRADDVVNKLQSDMIKKQEKVPVPNGFVLHAPFGCFFPDYVSSSALGEDGLGKKFSAVLPDFRSLGYNRSMFGSIKLTFVTGFHVGDTISMEEELLDLKERPGKSGNILVSTTKHSYYLHRNGQLSLAQTATIDLLSMVDAAAPPSSTSCCSPSSSSSSSSPPKLKILDVDDDRLLPKTFDLGPPVDALTLFRFSSSTANNHRIHYDRHYAMEVEGFKEVVVHGPLLLIWMINALNQEYEGSKNELQSFEMRAIAPSFVGDRLVIKMSKLDGDGNQKVYVLNALDNAIRCEGNAKFNTKINKNKA